MKLPSFNGSPAARMKSKLHTHPAGPYPHSSQHYLLFARLQSHWPSFSIPNARDPFPPQGLCMYYFLCLDHLGSAFFLANPFDQPGHHCRMVFSDPLIRSHSCWAHIAFCMSLVALTRDRNCVVICVMIYLILVSPTRLKAPRSTEHLFCIQLYS